jgi:hypothetical protein
MEDSRETLSSSGIPESNKQSQTELGGHASSFGHELALNPVPPPHVFFQAFPELSSPFKDSSALPPPPPLPPFVEPPMLLPLLISPPLEVTRIAYSSQFCLSFL